MFRDFACITIERSEEVAAKAQWINSHGFTLECEVIQSGDISLFVSDGTRTTYAMRVSKPGLGTLPASGGYPDPRIRRIESRPATGRTFCRVSLTF